MTKYIILGSIFPPHLPTCQVRIHHPHQCKGPIWSQRYYVHYHPGLAVVDELSNGCVVVKTLPATFE